jgi:small-conductance mechanosensitive channel
VRHELRKRIFHRFKEEGIGIPFPTRTLHIDSLAKNGQEKRAGFPA